MKLGQKEATIQKSKKFHNGENSQPLPKMTLWTLGFLRRGSAGNGQNKKKKMGKNGLSINKMKGKVLFVLPKLPGPWPKICFGVHLLPKSEGTPLWPNDGCQWQNLLRCDYWVLVRSPESKMVGFWDLVGSAYVPVSKNVAVKDKELPSAICFCRKRWFLGFVILGQ